MNKKPSKAFVRILATLLAAILVSTSGCNRVDSGEGSTDSTKSEPAVSDSTEKTVTEATEQVTQEVTEAVTQETTENATQESTTEEETESTSAEKQTTTEKATTKETKTTKAEKKTTAAQTTKKSKAAVTTTAASDELEKSFEDELKDANSKVVDDALLIADGMMESMDVFSYVYDPLGRFFYTESDPWQRAFGFNTFYDFVASLSNMYLDTVRLKFTYGDSDWMIQMWKGQYGLLFVGSEIGIYTKEKNSWYEHYEAADDDHRISMNMTFYNDGKKIFTRRYKEYWWCTGFVGGIMTAVLPSARRKMAVESTMTFYDAEMTNLVVEELEAAGFRRAVNVELTDADAYEVRGNSIRFFWQYADDGLAR